MKTPPTFYVVLFIASSAFGFWDAFTTYLGIMNIMHNQFFTIVLTLVINGILAMTFKIWYGSNEPLNLAVKGLWILAIICDFITAFVGNRAYSGIENGHGMQDFLIVAMTIFTVAGTLYSSYLLFRKQIFGNLEN
jgi:hypothetical protein